MADCEDGHGRFLAPCSAFRCDECGGPLCQVEFRRVQYAPGSTGSVCPGCYSKFDDSPTVSADGWAVAYERRRS